MAWYNLVTDSNASVALMEFDNGNVQNGIQTDTNGTTLRINNDLTTVTGSSLTVGTWSHIAMTIGASGSNHLGYVNGVLDMTIAVNNINATKLWFGNNPFAEFFNGRIAAIKIYGAVLTADEILTEMQYFVPIRSANLNTWLPCIDPVANTNAVDWSGVGGNMTVGGTLTVEDGPPIAWGPISEDVMGMAYDAAKALAFQPYQPWQLRAPLLAM